MLYFSIHLPTQRIPQAGQRLCYKRLLSLSQDHQIHLVSQFNNKEAPYLDENYKFCSSAEFIKITNYDRIINLFFNINLPLSVAIRKNNKTLKTVNSLINKYKISEVFIEYEQGALLFPVLNDTIVKTVVFHDVISQQIQRKFHSAKFYSPRKLFFYFELKRIIAWEKHILKKIDHAIVFSDKDRDLLIKLGFDQSKITTDHPHVDDIFYCIKRNNYDPKTILFWGALDRVENQDGLIWFIQSILPKIKLKIPDVKLYIVGANPSPEILKYSSENIIITGYVDNPVPFFEKAAIAIAPLRLGAGVKIKVLEFMAANIFTICTSVAAEGITHDATQLAIADNEIDFAQHIKDRLYRP